MAGLVSSGGNAAAGFEATREDDRGGPQSTRCGGTIPWHDVISDPRHKRRQVHRTGAIVRLLPHAEFSSPAFVQSGRGRDARGGRAFAGPASSGRSKVVGDARTTIPRRSAS